MSRSIDDYINRRYLHKSDLPSPRTATVKHTTDDTMQDGAIKAAIHFEEEDIKPLLANVTNLKSIARISGTSMLDDWTNTKVELFNDENVEFRGEVGAIRVRRPGGPAQSMEQAVNNGPRFNDSIDDDLPETFG